MSFRKIHNFNAGPSILPKKVLKASCEAIFNYNNSGFSILEISHRSEDFYELFQNTVNQIKKTASLTDDYEVLLLQGGATLQFAMVPYNLMKEGGKAVYLDTGFWASSAIREAKRFGYINVIRSSKKTNYDRIPKNFKILEDYDYFHVTSNNTIFGTQIKNFSSFEGILVSDMSSDIFSRQIDFNQFDLIYAGAQKNIGISGVTLVIIKKQLLGRSGRKISSYLDYNIHVSKNGIFNTPNVFGIYVMYKTLLWLEKLGGIIEIEKINNKKAALLYNEIDRNLLFKGHSKIEDRSMMNVTFNLINESRSFHFDNMWKSAGISGLKAHRSMGGGYRASIYNAMPIESIELLVEIMKDFERKG